MVLTESPDMQARESLYHRTEARHVYDRSKLEVDVAKLAIAVIAELLIFFLWFHFPIRERYEVLAHVVLPVCMVFPFLNYRYLILVPFIAFIPDIARAFDFDISHSLISLPIAFLAGFLPFINRPRTAILAGYTVVAIIASHLIIDTRKYATIENIAGYPWADLVLYTLLLTVIGFVLLQALRFTEPKTAEGRLL
ncbi:MAG: hypothetical protein ACXV5P_03290 [Halobacteriota archaeon]